MPDETDRHPAVEEFLAEVGRQLGRAGDTRRADDLREMGQHLDLLMAGLQRQGLSADAAASAAIESFGRAEHIGHAMRAARRRPIRRYAGFYVTFLIVQAAVLLAVILAIGGGANLLQRPLAFWPTGVVLLIAPIPFILLDRRRRRRERLTAP
jgi:hypothetical protein